MIHAFSLMQRIDGGVDVSPAEEKRTLESLFQQADKRLEGYSEDWQLAKYALASWIDEMLVDAHIWKGKTGGATTFSNGRCFNQGDATISFTSTQIRR